MPFSKPMAQQRAIDFIEEFYRECVEQPAFLGGADVQRFPQKLSGGGARILGQHFVRGGPIERPFTFEGELLTTLSTITPHKFKKLPVAIRPPQAVSETKSRWKPGGTRDVAHYLKFGIPRETHHTEVYSAVIFLAHQVLKGRSPSQAELRLADWLATIGDKSRAIMDGDTTKRNLLDPSKAAEYVRIAARMREERGKWTPLAFAEKKNPKTGRAEFETHHDSRTLTCPEPVHFLYQVLCEYVRAKFLDPDQFGIDAETLSDYCGWEKRHVQRVIAAAIKAGIIRLVASAGFQPGIHPRPNLYALARANVIQ